MNVTQQGLIALMTSAVLRQPRPLPTDFNLQEALPLIRQHHIAALVYDGAERCGLTRKDPAMFRYTAIFAGQRRPDGAAQPDFSGI